MHNRASIANFWLNIILMAMLAVIGFFAKEKLDSIDKQLMPRREIELVIEAIKSDNMRTQADVALVRSEISRLEMKIATTQKAP